MRACRYRRKLDDLIALPSGVQGAMTNAKRGAVGAMQRVKCEHDENEHQLTEKRVEQAPKKIEINLWTPAG